MSVTRVGFFPICGVILLFALPPAASDASATESAEQAPGSVDRTGLLTVHELIGPDKAKKDLEVLFQTLTEVHPNLYAYVSEDKVKETRDRLYAQLDRPVSRLDFYWLIAPAVASLRNGHTFVRPFLDEFKEYVKGGGTVFPIVLQIEEEKVLLAGCGGAENLAPGSEVLSICGEAARETTQRYAGYFAAEGRPRNPEILERPENLWALLWLEHGQAGELAVEIKTLAGKVGKHAVKALPYEQAKAQATGRGVSEPPLRYRHLPERKTGIITVASLGDLEAFRGLLKETFSAIQAEGVQNLIIDLRGCPGGDSRSGDALIEYLTDKPYKQFDRLEMRISRQLYEKYGEQLKWQEDQIGSMWSMELPPTQPKKTSLQFQGSVFVLISRRSFSSSTSFAAAMKHYGLATLVGEETGDTTTVYGECFYFTLPHSGLKVSVACKRFVMPGDQGDGRGVLPHHEVKQTAEDLAAGRDTVLQYTLDLIGPAER